jgi:serine/threonine protein phosphatase PrpC
MATLLLPISEAQANGSRLYQEDYRFISTMNEGTLFGVFDGHGGNLAAATANDQFPVLFADVPGLSDIDVPTAIKNAFAKLVVLTENFESGSTASIVYLPWNKSTTPWTVDTAWVAVLGDSPVIIKGAEGKINISPEHNVRTNIAEKNAAEQRGGYVRGGYLHDPRDRNGMGLQMARALGDRHLSRVLSREPDVYSVNVGPGSFVLAATDGAFDPSHYKFDDAAKSVVSMLEYGLTAENVVNRAVNARTGDNVTAIVARFE